MNGFTQKLPAFRKRVVVTIARSNRGKVLDRTGTFESATLPQKLSNMSFVEG